MEFRYLVDETGAQSSLIHKLLSLFHAPNASASIPHLSILITQDDLSKLSPARRCATVTPLGEEPLLAHSYLCGWQSASIYQLLRLSRIEDTAIALMDPSCKKPQRDDFQEHGALCTPRFGRLDVVIGERVYSALAQPFGGKFVAELSTGTLRIESAPYASETSEWRAARKQA